MTFQKEEGLEAPIDLKELNVRIIILWLYF